MRKSATLLLLAVTVLFTSCDSKKARDFNDKLVKAQKEIMDKYQGFMAGDNEVENRKKAKAYIELKMEELKNLESVKDGEGFKQAMIDDIGVLGKINDVELKLANPAIAEQEAAALNTEKAELMEKAGKYDNAVIEEQKKFAKAKGFKLEYKY